LEPLDALLLLLVLARNYPHVVNASLRVLVTGVLVMLFVLETVTPNLNVMEPESPIPHAHALSILLAMVAETDLVAFGVTTQELVRAAQDLLAKLPTLLAIPIVKT